MPVELGVGQNFLEQRLAARGVVLAVVKLDQKSERVGIARLDSQYLPAVLDSQLGLAQGAR